MGKLCARGTPQAHLTSGAWGRPPLCSPETRQTPSQRTQLEKGTDFFFRFIIYKAIQWVARKQSGCTGLGQHGHTIHSYPGK